MGVERNDFDSAFCSLFPPSESPFPEQSPPLDQA